MRVGAIALVLLMVFAAGCAKAVTEGKKIDESRITNLFATCPTPESIVGVFGSPQKVEKTASGEQKFIYTYYHLQPHWWTMDETEKQELVITTKGTEVMNYRYKGQLYYPLSREEYVTPR